MYPCFFVALLGGGQRCQQIFATAFSDSVVSQSTRELQLATLKTTQQLDIITEAMNEGDKDKALNAHRQAVFFA